MVSQVALCRAARTLLSNHLWSPVVCFSSLLAPYPNTYIHLSSSQIIYTNISLHQQNTHTHTHTPTRTPPKINTMGVGPSKQKQTAPRGTSKSPIAKVSTANIKKERRRAQRAAEDDWKAAEHFARQVSHGLRAGLDVRGRLASLSWVEREKVYIAFRSIDPQMVPHWPREESLKEFQHAARQERAQRDEWRARENMLNQILKREGRDKCSDEDLEKVFKTPRSAFGFGGHAERQQGPRVTWADQHTDYRGVQTARNLAPPRPRNDDAEPRLRAHANCELKAPRPIRRMNVAKLEMSKYPDREQSTQDRYASRRNPNRRGFDLEI